MPIDGDDYDTRSQTELYEQMAATLQDRTNGNAEDFEGSAIQSLLETHAELLASNQEQSLKTLFQAGYLPTADGRELELRALSRGIKRKPATPATGVATFARGSEPTSTYQIKRNVPITTVDGEVEFLTTEKGTIGLLDGFNSSSLDSAWSGDTGSFSTQSTTVDDGANALEIAATAGAQLRRTDYDIREGAVVRCSVYLASGSAVGCLVGLQDGSNFYEVRIDQGGGTLGLYLLDGGTETQLASTSVTIPTNEWATIELDWSITNELSAQLFDASDTALASVDASDTTYRGGGIGIVSRDGSTTKYADTFTQTATTLNIEGATGGEQTNLGGDRLTVLPSPPTGIDSVTNPIPTGNTEYLDTNNEPLVVGTNRETDEQLRERALTSAARGGAATPDALESALLGIDDVIGARAFVNDNPDTKDGAGRPPISVEFVIYGGDDQSIAETIHRNAALTERFVGGYVGTSNSYTITDSLTADDETYTWSRPTIDGIDITLDIVVDETYEGDDAVKSTVVQYVGGTDTNGGQVNGTSVGENVRVDALRDRIVGPELGVRGIASITIDSNGDGSDDTTTDANGLTVYEVATSDVAQTDATDGSISITTTQV